MHDDLVCGCHSDTSFLASSLLNQWACSQGSTEVLQGLYHMVLLYKDIWLYPCWVCTSHRVKFRPWYGTISWGDQPTIRYQFDCFGFLPARNGKWLCPQWNWNLLCMLDLLSNAFQHQYQKTFGVTFSSSIYSTQYCFWLRILQNKRRVAMASNNSLILPYTSWLRSSSLNRNIECLPGSLGEVLAKRQKF